MAERIEESSVCWEVADLWLADGTNNTIGPYCSGHGRSRKGEWENVGRPVTLEPLKSEPNEPVKRCTWGHPGETKVPDGPGSL